ncbi:MAG: nicotinamide mononucleotide transporter [Flavipsychrobacter sp.]|jgi:nicotinamide mononucleotide transporter|nr:nicotinamide mononucleotide transporter [Flavipsychrobacter sp.]
MDFNAWLYLFKTGIAQTSVIEWIAVIFSVASVLLAMRNNVLLYPTGIVSTAIFIYLMGKPSTGLYAEALLNFYYFIMSIYGWWRWQKNKENENAVAITHNSKKDWAITIGIVAIGWTAFYLLLSKFTDSNVPAIDAFVSATACAGMWLLAKHKVENWVLLNISNLVAIPLLVYKGLALTSVLTVFLFIVAVLGYIRWSRLYELSLHKRNA